MVLSTGEFKMKTFLQLLILATMIFSVTSVSAKVARGGLMNDGEEIQSEAPVEEEEVDYESSDYND